MPATIHSKKITSFKYNYMPNEEQLSGEKSFEIIQQMIQSAKTKFTDNGHGWLLWGSMIFTASGFNCNPRKLIGQFCRY